MGILIGRILTALAGAVASAMGGWLFKKLFNAHYVLEARVTALEQTLEAHSHGPGTAD